MDFVEDQDQPEIQLPGFRFHPTDEELVGFYLRRKVEKKPISIELIKPIDIYKYDPWDLPKASCSAEEREWYFFCRRGRKYKNSIRPNRVTGSGFWKATGIDKPVNSQTGDYKNNNNNNQCIGLKKTLVYYRGSAGKGTKTDWMMHEFRLPAINNDNNRLNVDTLQEAEIWTLCRIFKRNVSYRKYTSDWRELATKRSHQNSVTISSKKLNNNSMESKNNNNKSCIDFSAYHEEKKGSNIVNHHMIINNNIANSHHHESFLHVSEFSSMGITSTHNNNNNNNNNNNVYMDSSLFQDENDHQLFSTNYANWDELKAVVEYALEQDIA